MAYNLTHIDTCLPCYLMDHHNREGESLMCVPVDGATTHREVLESLLSDLDCMEDIDHDAARAAIIEEWSTVEIMDWAFDSLLEQPDPDAADIGESVYAYFVLQTGK